MLFDVKSLQGPIYNVDSAHKFQQIETKIADLKTLQSPVYSGVEREHQYFAQVGIPFEFLCSRNDASY